MFNLYSGNIAVGGGGATSINVAASGTGVNTAPTVTAGTATGITLNSATVPGTITITGCTAISAYGVEISTTINFANGSGTQFPGSNLSAGNFSVAVSPLTQGTTYYYHTFATNGAGTSYSAQGSFVTAAPTLTASALTAFGNVCINTTTGPNAFTITGTNLSTANVTVGPLSGFTYSTTSAGTYTTSLSLTQTGGSYSQQIFVDFAPVAVQSYSGNIAVAGGGAVSINEAAAGSGVNTAPTVTAGAAGSITVNSATLPGTITVAGCSAISAYGVEISTTNNFVNGSGTQFPGSNLSAGSFSVVVSPLTQSTTYYYHTFATNGVGTAYSAQGSFITSTPTITTGAISGSPFCVTASTGVAVSVPFTSTGTFSGNTYTAQGSNAAGSFTTPITIGTLVSNSNSGTINATIPANTPTGTGYLIRVISSSPAVTGSSSTALTVNLAANSIAPTATQNIFTGANGATLTVTEQSAASSRLWAYGTTSGGPYATSTGVTAATYTPNFATPGTFFVVCLSTYACAVITSNQVQVIVAPTYKSQFLSMSTGSLTWCAGETRDVTVTVKNIGTATWTDGTGGTPTINVGLKWNSQASCPAVGSNWCDYHLRTSANNLAPGATGTYTFTITASNNAGAGYTTPLSAGTNNLTFDLVEENISWFGNNGGGTGPGNVVSTSPNQTISAPADKTVSALASAVCSGNATNITVASSLATTTYQLRNDADDTNIGSPLTGNGGTINLPTGTLTSTTTFNVLAKLTATGCTGQMSITPTVTVNAKPSVSLTASPTPICLGSISTLTATNSGGSLGTFTGTNNTAVTIPDNSATGASSSITLPVGVLTAASNITLTINALHPRVGDLVITLTSPSCGATTISSRQSSTSDQDNLIGIYTFISTSSTSFPGTDGNGNVPIGTYNATFSGLTFPCSNIAGVWTLKIADLASGGSGSSTLTSWTISITNASSHLFIQLHLVVLAHLGQ